MKQVLQNFRSGELRVADVPAPVVQGGQVLVRNLYSVVSAGTERHAVDFAQKGLLAKARARPDLVRKVMQYARTDGIETAYRLAVTRLDDWKPLGYSSSGRVVEVGPGAAGVARGALVACAGAGYANHAEWIVVPANLTARVPEGVRPEGAAFATLGAIALEGIHRAELSPGESVGVIGLGLVGQLTALILRQYNFPVLGMDVNPAQVERMKALGMTATVTGEAVGAAQALSAGAGLDAVIVTAATASSDPIRLAGEVSRMRGRVSAVGLVGMDVPRQLYYDKELDLRVSRSYGPGRYDPQYEEKGHDYPIGHVRWTEKRNLQEFLRLLATGLDLTPLITHTVPLEQAPDVYEMLLRNPRREYFLGVLFRYDVPETVEDERPRATRIEMPAVARREGALGRQTPRGKVRVGVIGAGQYARGTLLPELRKLAGVEIRAVCSASGRSAEAEARVSGSAYATSDARHVLDDPDIDAVVIATRHNLHARLAVEAIARGKHVLVEKPPALNAVELDKLVAELASHPQVRYMVGYNRRFAPLARTCRDTLARLPRPFVMHYRVNGGAIEASSWVHDPEEGGGRIVGEVCHFVDLVQFFAGAPTVRVMAQSVGGEGPTASLLDNVSIELALADGSLATILYTALGARALAKERVEVFAGGQSLVLDNFKQATVYGREVKTIGGTRQDKGQSAMLRAWVDALENDGAAPVATEDWAATSRATFACLEAIRNGAPVEV